MSYNSALNDYKNICESCTIYIVLLSVFLTISIDTGRVFIYFCWYSKNEVNTNINTSTKTVIY